MAPDTQSTYNAIVYRHYIKGVAFDLDETLAMSKEPLTNDMADVLSRLLRYLPVAIVSGATRERMELQVVSRLPTSAYPNVTLGPTCGSALYDFDGECWRTVYEKNIDPSEAGRIATVVKEVVEQSGILEDTPTWGPQIEFRGSQVTFSALGQNAPYEEKSHWDPDKSKRLYLRERIANRLPEYDAALGGTTSIDIVQKGIDKAYGVRKFAEHIGAPVEDILYVGDDLRPGGNDYVVSIKTKARTFLVTGPEDTKRLIEEILMEFE